MPSTIKAAASCLLALALVTAAAFTAAAGARLPLSTSVSACCRLWIACGQHSSCTAPIKAVCCRALL